MTDWLSGDAALRPIIPSNTLAYWSAALLSCSVRDRFVASTKKFLDHFTARHSNLCSHSVRMAEAPVEHLLPRHQAESEPVVDHGVTPARKVGRAGERAADKLASLHRLEGAAARPSPLLPHPLDFLALQSATRERGTRKRAVGLALGLSHFHEPLGAPLEGLGSRPKPVPIAGLRPVARKLRSSQVTSLAPICCSRPRVERTRTRKPSPPRPRS